MMIRGIVASRGDERRISRKCGAAALGRISGGPRFGSPRALTQSSLRCVAHPEVSVMQKLQTSGDVVRLFAHDLNATYKSARYPLLVMELASTDLKKLSTELGKEGPGAARPGACLPRRQVPPAVHLQMAAALLRGLGALSTAGYVHSDVKMENVFVFRGARRAAHLCALTPGASCRAHDVVESAEVRLRLSASGRR